MLARVNTDLEKEIPQSEKIENKTLITTGQARADLPSLLNFNDYRDFLKARAEFEKTKNARISANAIAKRWGVSPAFLSMLFAKKRHIGLNTCSELAKHLKLSEDEQMLMTIEILSTSAESPIHKRYFNLMRDQLRGFMHIEVKIQESHVDSDWVRYGSELHLTLSALMDTTDYVNDPDWVMSRLINKNYTREDIVKALNILNQEKFSSRKIGLSHVLAVGPVASPAYRPGYAAFGEALQEPERYTPNVFTSMSMTFSEEASMQALKEFRAMTQKLVDLATPEKPEKQDRVFIFSGGVFRVAGPSRDADMSNYVIPKAPTSDS